MSYVATGTDLTEPQSDSNLLDHVDDRFGPNLATSNVYNSGGYWLVCTQMMNYICPSDRIADVAFDPLEELIWCVSHTGQLTSFYSTTMERYVTATIPLLSNITTIDGCSPFIELKQVFPSPRQTEHSVFVLANNALHAYDKFGKPLTYTADKRMVELECLAVANSTGSTLHNGVATANKWSVGSGFDRYFVGGLQPTLIELDATDRWGDVVSTIDVGVGGSVVLRPFSSGLCAGTTTGKVLLIDARTSRGIVREIVVHTAEISDITVDGYGNTLVTCGWSRVGESGLRIDRLLRVYDLRCGRAQIPLSASIDPSFLRFIPGCNDRLLTASQTGAFQTIQWCQTAFFPEDLGQLWMSYDRLVAFDLSQNGNSVIFATEGGQLQLYSRNMNVCQFNISPTSTEFASPFAESLWATNNPSGVLSSKFSLSSLDDPNNCLYGTNIATLGKAAAESTGLQILAASLHQPTNMTSTLADHVEHHKTESAEQTINNVYKPIEVDDYRFALSSIPFAAHPPPVFDPSQTTDDINCNVKLDFQCTSDWPKDVCPSKPRVMDMVDPELLNNANQKRVVRKPSGWGSVWHPYPLANDPIDKCEMDYDSLEFGRFYNSVEVTCTTETC